MACPYFLPQAPLREFSDLYSGICTADAQEAISPDLIEACNRGYARERCTHAAQSESDAFRFLVKSQANGIVQIAWSSERNHHPVAVGTVQIESTVEAGSALHHQARIVALDYLKHIGA